MTEADEWPPKRARSMEDWNAYWSRQRWDRRKRRALRIRLAPWRRRIGRVMPRRLHGDVLHLRQRLRRGWSYRDLWGMDYFIARVCGEMTAQLLEVAHGYPCRGHADDGAEPACIDPETHKPRACDCQAEYDEALGKISEGLRAYTAEHPDDLPVSEWLAQDEKRIAAGQEAFRLIAEWLPTLWD